MAIVDFHCNGDSNIVARDILRDSGFSAPEVYLDPALMEQFSLLIKEKTDKSLCRLPFCHTIEAESMGGLVNYSFDNFGLRMKDPIFDTIDHIRPMNFDLERLQGTLYACHSLASQGENVLFQVSGPMTILTGVIRNDVLFRLLRKDTENLLARLERLSDDLLTLMKMAQNNGASFISYADPMGSVDILGPKFCQLITERFTYPLLKKAQESLDIDIVLCPKTAFALIGCGLAELEKVTLPHEMTYQQALVNMKGKLGLVGHTCINYAKTISDMELNTIKLK